MLVFNLETEMVQATLGSIYTVLKNCKLLSLKALIIIIANR